MYLLFPKSLNSKEFLHVCLTNIYCKPLHSLQFKAKCVSETLIPLDSINEKQQCFKLQGHVNYVQFRYKEKGNATKKTHVKHKAISPTI